MQFRVHIILLFLWNAISGQDVSELDRLTPFLRNFEKVFLDTFEPPGQRERILKQADDLHKLQPRLNDDVPFPCSIKAGRSKIKPNSVHKLRPGDIDVIAALGDSLTAGNGLLASNVFAIYVQNRGISFLGGGEETWRRFTTLPNIMKEFNPNLIGYANQTAFGYQKETQLNIADNGAMSRDMLFMAKKLVARIKNDPRINVQEDWKMISIMIGANDICAEVCYQNDPESTVISHRRDLITVLRILRDNLPRTIVNVLAIPPLKEIVQSSLSNQPPRCYFTRNVFCPCLFGIQFENMRQSLFELITKWQDTELDVANEPEFDRKDFTVVAQPFCKNYPFPRFENGLTDYSSFSEDCFHLSQKENARAAISIWNNMLEPVGLKNIRPVELFQFKCPSRKHPYIFTKRNSVR